MTVRHKSALGETRIEFGRKRSTQRGSQRRPPWLRALGHQVLTLKERLEFVLYRLRVATAEPCRDLTAVVYTVGQSPHLERCLRSIRAQLLQPGRIEIVRDVSPVSEAVRVAVAMVETEFFVSIDDDMVLDRSCFLRLYGMITSRKAPAEAILPLEDLFWGRRYGVRVYRTSVVRQYMPPRNVEEDRLHVASAWDRALHEHYRAAGHSWVASRINGGLHHPVLLPHEAYWNHRVYAEKIRYFKEGWPELERQLDSLCRYWMKAHDDVGIYALAGFFAGLSGEFMGPVVYAERDTHEAFQSVRRTVEELTRQQTSSAGESHGTGPRPQ